MSQLLQKTVSIALHTVIDLFTGATVAGLIDWFFLQKGPPLTGSTFQLAVGAISQATLLMLAAEEVRSLSWANPQDDPTGGVMFMLALGFMSQRLWSYMQTLFLGLTDSILNQDTENGESPK